MLTFFHGHYQQYQYFPLYVFDGTTGFPLAAWLRPGTVACQCQTTHAIPAIFINRFLDSRLTDFQTGQAFTQNGQKMLVVKVTTLDPLNRIRELRVEGWAGISGLARPASLQPPCLVSE